MVRAFVVLVLLCLAPVASAQAQSVLYGVVWDPSGQIAADVTVVVEHEVTGERFETRSARLGTYAFYGLPSGRFTISVNQDGLTFLATDVQIKPRQKTGLDIILRVGRDERITVHTETTSPTLALSDGAAGASFSSREIETMPLSSGRTLQSMYAVVPGVVVTDSTGTLAQFTAGGQRRFANTMTIDGMSADLAIDLSGPGVGEDSTGSLPAFSSTGSTQTLVPLAAIGEIEVRTTNAPPEHQRAPGAQTAIVTRAGGERTTAAAFMDFRPSALAASDWFSNANPTAPKRRVSFWNAGASLGGPVPFASNRLFYFASGERQRIERPLTTTYSVPSLSLRDTASPAVRPLLDAFPEPNGRELSNGLAALTREFPVESKLSAFSLRVDGNLTDRHRLFTRINRGTSGGDELDTVFQTPRVSFNNRETAATNTATAGITSIFSSATHDLRVNVSTHEGSVTSSPASYGDAGLLPLDLLVPPEARNDAWVRVQALPTAAAAVANGVLARGRQEQWQIADTWTWLKGRHEWRFGFDFRRVTTFNDATQYRYSYRFLNESDFRLGRVRTTIEQSLPARSRRDTTALFVQDTFRVTPRLSLNYGLRYSVRPAPRSVTDVNPLLLDFAALPDIQPLPDGAALWKTSRRDFAPQATATYQLVNTAGRETSLRAGWSLAFDEVTSPGLRVFGGGAPYLSRRSVSTSAFPLTAQVLSAPPLAPFDPGDLAEYYAFDEHLRSPRTHQWQVTVDQALGPVQRVGLAYIGAAGRDLPYWHAYPIPTGLSGVDMRIHAFSSDGRSDYHALLAQYVRRMSRGVQGSLSYTWSHAIDLDSGDVLFPLPPPSLVSPSSNRGSADFDRRHVLQAAVSYRIPGRGAAGWLYKLTSDWQIDLTGIVRSGAPITVTTPRPIENGGLYEMRPDVVPNVPIWIADPTSGTGQRLNPAAFLAPEDSRQGTAGRNVLRNTPLRQLDLSLSRFIRLGERRVTLRLDAYNVLNVPSFGPVDTVLGGSLFGRPFRSYADALGTGTLSGGGLVPIQQAGGPRSLQVSLRFTF